MVFGNSLKTSSNSALVVDPPGNRDGKGVSSVMLDWYRTRPRGVPAKPQPQVLSELFTSMLVLSATFKFRPSVGVPKYLYWIDGEYFQRLHATAVSRSLRASLELGDQCAASCRRWRTLLPGLRNAMLFHEA